MTPELIETTLHALCDLAEVQTIRHFRAPMEITNKLEKGFDPVTIADQAAETAIRTYLIKHFPDHGILGEEHASINENADYCWIIDPIDGTRAYISGLPTWGTLIGLSYKGTPIAGVMHQPFTGEKFLYAGKHSFLEHHQKKQRMSTSSVTDLGQATLMSTAPELFTGSDENAFSQLSKACRLTRFGFDCYAYAMVAAGHVELVVECGLNAYDIAPLIPVIEQAGGCVASWKGESAAGGGKVIAAANDHILNAALEIFAQYA